MTVIEYQNSGVPSTGGPNTGPPGPHCAAALAPRADQVRAFLAPTTPPSEGGGPSGREGGWGEDAVR